MAQLDRLRRNANYRSLNRLAEVLCQAIPEHSRKPRSVGAKLSDLKNGKTVWWEGNPKLSEKLAELLNCSVSDLGIHLDSAPFATYRFEGFPELKPLDLRREEPCDLGYWSLNSQDATEDIHPWLGTHSTDVSGGSVRSGIMWATFPPGTGLDLFWNRLQVNGPFECMTRECVSDAKERLQDPSPFCLRVSEIKGADDRQALKHRAPMGSVLIVAPFSQPASPSRPSRIKGLFDIANDSNVMQYEYRLKPDWQRLLVNWLDSRIRTQRAGKWNKDHVLHWVSVLPSYSIISSPRALIEIAGLAYRVSLGQLQDPSEEGSAQQVLSLLQIGEGAAQQDVFLNYVRTWFFSSGLPWREWLEPTGWSTLTDLVSTLPESSPSNPASSKTTPESTDSGRAEHDPASLSGTEFVKESSTGAKMLTPRIAAEAYINEELQRLIKNQDHSSWGVLCFDEQRSARVLDALAFVDGAAIEECASHVIQSAAHDPATIGASEALFSVMWRNEWAQPSETMLALREMVLERLVKDTEVAPRTWSAVSEHRDWWVVACWSWSLATDPPPYTLPPGWSDYFPGWVDDSSFPLPIGISIPYEDARLINLPLAQRRLLSLASRITERIPVSPSFSIDLFHPSLLSRSIQRGWQVLPEWWSTIMSAKWAEDCLAESVDSGSTATQILISLFRSMAARKDATLMMYAWLHRESSLKNALFHYADPTEFVAALDRQPLSLAASLLSLLPSSFRRKVLSYCREHANATAYWRDISHDLCSDMDEDVAQWVENSGLEGDLAASWLWRESPERALSMLSDHPNPSCRDRLLDNFEGDLTVLNKVISYLERCTDECRPRGASDFARDQLSCSGRLAPRLFALIAERGEQ